MFILILVFVLFEIVVKGEAAGYCLSQDDNPYLMFSTKTPYDLVRGSGGSQTQCKAIQIWMMSRHGTRNADEDDQELMKKSLNYQKDLKRHLELGYLPRYRGLCMDDINLLTNWTWDETIEKVPDYLNERGWEELFSLGQRFKNRYPDVLKGPYNSNDFYFRHTLFQKTNESCRAFIDGIFGVGAHKFVDIVSVEEDETMLGYRNCDKWLEEVEMNPDKDNERNQFRHSEDFLNLIRGVSKRLGYKTALKYGDIISMYNNCRFDKSRKFDQISPWCSVFSKKDLFLMDYYEDLWRYSRYSYGNEINRKTGNVILRHLLETFERTVKNNGTVIGPKLISMFSHDTVMDMLHVALNFAKDQGGLTGSDYGDLLINRRYRSSRNIPFGCNVFAILHDCGCKKYQERFQVQFFVNEKHMELDGCERGLCSWNHLMSTFPEFNTWNLDFCTNVTNVKV